jgi:hypothetical protein
MDMLWVTCKPLATSRRLLAPTWSWAHRPGPKIYHKFTDFQSHIRVQSAEVDPIGDDEMGEVSGGSLTLEAGFLEAQRNEYGGEWSSRKSFTVNSHGKTYNWGSYYPDQDIDSEKDQTIVILLIGSDIHLSVRRYRYLLLARPCDNDQHWSRIGYAEPYQSSRHLFSSENAQTRTFTIV